MEDKVYKLSNITETFDIENLSYLKEFGDSIFDENTIIPLIRKRLDRT